MDRRTFLNKTSALTLGLLRAPENLMALSSTRSKPMTLKPIVEAEDSIYTYTPADNGAGPLWCHGSTVVARHGDDVYVAGLETLPDQKPLNNCRWLLYRRSADGWELVHRDPTGRTREPSPVARLGSGDLLVSANPTLTAPGTYNGPAEPTVFRFDTAAITSGPAREQPAWQGEPGFSEHSYRTVTADGANSEVLYMQNVGYDVAHMSFLGRDGNWQSVGTLQWPWGGEYEKPQWLRLCYPNVMLRDRSAHFFGVGDIVEPVEEWKNAKFEITNRQWDYVFRRLFYAYTPDITAEPFCDWIEVANRDATAGYMRNGDIHVDAEGTAHLIWCEANVDERLRDRFFPNETIVHSLEYLTLRDGQIQTRRTLARAAEGEDAPRPQLARFHALPDGTLLAIALFGRNASTSEHPSTAYRIAPLSADTDDLAWIDIPFARPMPGTFLTNTVRGGSAPSALIDLVGMSPDEPHTLGYARVRIEM